MSNPNPSPATRFKPGNTLGGRKPDTLADKARKLTDLALQALVLDLAVPERRANAARELLDRGWGKPAVSLTAQVDSTLTVSGIDAPPRHDTIESAEQWLIRRRNELAILVTRDSKLD